MATRKGRPALKDGERSVPVNVRLPESEYDRLCSYARFSQVSLAKAMRMRMVPLFMDDCSPPASERNRLETFEAQLMKRCLDLAVQGAAFNV